MSRDVPMYSDDDQPLTARPGHSGQNGHVAQNGNSWVGGESSLSQDEEIPLSQVSCTNSEPVTPDVRALKRKKAVADDSSSDEGIPLASSPAKSIASAATHMNGACAATPTPTPVANGKKKIVNGVKAEPASDAAGGGDDDDDDDAPITKKKRVNGHAKSKPPRKKVKTEDNDQRLCDDSEDDKPIVKKAPAKGKRKLKEESDADEESFADDDKPLKKPRAKKAAPNKRAKKEESSVTVSKAKRKAVKAEAEDGEATPKKGKKKKEEEDEVFRWWEQEDPNGDGTQKWQTLEHNGVYFPPPYESLPSHVKMKYAGKPVDLPPDSEEVAGFYAALLETDHAKDNTFNKNFFDDWLKVLRKYPPRTNTKITDFSLCNFRPMWEYFEEEKAKKKALSSAERKELKAAKDAVEAPYTHCVLDGRKEKVGNFRVEPPGLFRGRGDHPKKGALKYRVRPEDITINIGEGVPTPKPNMPGKWKDVIHDNTVTWLANWTENVNGNYKYVFLAAGSSIKGQSDMSKFEKARELKKHVDRIRQDYTTDLRNRAMLDRQRATAMYFIDRLALRAGNEKGDDEADTVGCCSLRCEHVTLQPPNQLVFDFLGKDSIRYYNQVGVDEQVYKNIRIFKEGKEDDDQLFDRVHTSLLNKHLASYMKGLTAKVFRTYNASITFQQQLDQGTPEKGTVQEKLNAYNHANRMVAILCNHQRAVPKTHEQSMGKMREKLRGFKYERMKLRHALFTIDSKFKKKKEYRDDESDLDDDAIAEHEEQMKAKEREKAEKKFQKDNEKLADDGKDPQEESVLKAKFDEIEAEFKRLKKERGTNKAELKRDRPVEKIEEAIEKLDEKIKTFKLQMEDREAGKEVALGTSKINYLDPRITAAWCKSHDVPIERIFSKTLLTKFPWAMEVDSEWKF
ncbi:DNA topoisomerase 1 [Sparassis crispa]|uniref:DNA topoisomerase I n=1 Tax=Sparassis crispa TaxID=139825 RepID=A0A401GEL5_9APHY|nr:DNA topoisomerase 1 [Sparassis crispa]GBE80607.1 DNA topoisomerase 1 [Sparassis crispa]